MTRLSAEEERRRAAARARERRTDRRVEQVGIGKKDMKNALVEDAVDQAFDWVERGGAKRLWTTIKVVFFSLVALIVVAVIWTLESF